jgi:hypothetical protein
MVHRSTVLWYVLLTTYLIAHAWLLRAMFVSSWPSGSDVCSDSVLAGSRSDYLWVSLAIAVGMLLAFMCWRALFSKLDPQSHSWSCMVWAFRVLRRPEILLLLFLLLVLPVILHPVAPLALSILVLSVVLGLFLPFAILREPVLTSETGDDWYRLSWPLPSLRPTWTRFREVVSSRARGPLVALELRLALLLALYLVPAGCVFMYLWKAVPAHAAYAASLGVHLPYSVRIFASCSNFSADFGPALCFFPASLFVYLVHGRMVWLLAKPSKAELT